MWQAHAWRATISWAQAKKSISLHRSGLTSVFRCLLCCLIVGTSASYASDRLGNLNFGRDEIYNGQSIETRVLGGGDAEVDAWPSMAAIVIAGLFPLEDRFFCGGTVISDRWILTAAHCMFDPFGDETQPSDIRAVVGIVDLQDESATEVVVSNIYIHPQYDTGGGTLVNDIALLELATAVSVPSAILFDGDTEAVNESLAFIAGWGAIGVHQNNGSEIYPNLLQDATVPLVSLERCNSAESYQGGIIDTQVCAGYREGGVDACVGDSGGPLFIIEDGEQIQVGITSFGNGCGLANFFGVYTNLSAFRTWISDYVEISTSSHSTISVTVGETDSVEMAAVSVDPTTGFASSTAGTVNSATDEGIAVGSSSSAGSLNFFFISLLLGLSYLRWYSASSYVVLKRKRLLNDKAIATD